MAKRGSDASTVLVTGAAGGIGLALVQALLARRADATIYASTRNRGAARELDELARSDARVRVLECDLTAPAQLQVALSDLAHTGRLDQVINTAGVLHDEQGMCPERRLADVEPQAMLRAFATNAMTALLLAQAVEPWLRKSVQPVFASVSARVGSIADNRLGGWYSYRASKAALNMLLKTLSIEWSRGTPAITCVALHPGTVRTALSEPFVKTRSDDSVFSPDQSAEHLLDLVDSLGPPNTGNFYAWDGQSIPW